MTSYGNHVTFRLNDDILSFILSFFPHDQQQQRQPYIMTPDPLFDMNQKSGLSAILGYGLNHSLNGVGVFGIQMVTCLLALVMTEVASNATTATILLGVVDNLVSCNRSLIC